MREQVLPVRGLLLQLKFFHDQTHMIARTSSSTFLIVAFSVEAAADDFLLRRFTDRFIIGDAEAYSVHAHVSR